MTANITQSDVELYQGRDDRDRAFGFVHGEDGGFFFTWLDTLDATLASVEECEIDGDGGLDEAEVVEFLRSYLPTTKRGREAWAADAD